MTSLPSTSTQRKRISVPLFFTNSNIEIDYVHSAYSFPQKLFIILEEESYHSIIRWEENNICFRLLEADELVDKVLPKFFKQTKMTSFQRQLNSYGFRKISRGSEAGCFFHPKFKRGRVDLLPEVQRLPIKGTLESYDEVKLTAYEESFNPAPSIVETKPAKKSKKAGMLPPLLKLERNSSEESTSSFMSTSSTASDYSSAPYQFVDYIRPESMFFKHDPSNYLRFLHASEQHYHHVEPFLQMPIVPPQNELVYTYPQSSTLSSFRHAQQHVHFPPQRSWMPPMMESTSYAPNQSNYGQTMLDDVPRNTATTKSYNQDLSEFFAYDLSSSSSSPRLFTGVEDESTASDHWENALLQLPLLDSDTECPNSP